jgi:transcriptional/translational regulatory protein YebC/TACO1
VNAITNAKRGSLDKAAIETAIARGQGKSASGAALEDVTVEAMLPFGVATVLEYSTDQKARVLQEIRSIIKRAGGTVTPTSFMFEKKGRIWFERKPDVSVDDVLDEAIEAGAMDVEEEDGQLVVDTDPKDTTFLAERLCEKFGLTLERSEILYDPKEELMVELQDEQSTELGTIIESIEEDPGLQNIYMNVAG